MKRISKQVTMILPVLVATVGFALAAGVIAQESTWEVPEEALAEENPIEGTPEVLEEGAAIYEKRCQLCHGAEGKGDGPMAARIREKPRDLTPSEVRDRLTDGEIFYKISVGKPPMPSMEGTLTEDEIWTLVHYVRSLQAD